jgi:hypothetical protein
MALLPVVEQRHPHPGARRWTAHPPDHTRPHRCPPLQQHQHTTPQHRHQAVRRRSCTDSICLATAFAARQASTVPTVSASSTLEPRSTIGR